MKLLRPGQDGLWSLQRQGEAMGCHQLLGALAALFNLQKAQAGTVSGRGCIDEDKKGFATRHCLGCGIATPLGTDIDGRLMWKLALHKNFLKLIGIIV